MTPAPRQLALALDHPESLVREDFLSGPSNASALALVEMDANIANAPAATPKTANFPTFPLIIKILLRGRLTIKARCCKRYRQKSEQALRK